MMKNYQSQSKDDRIGLAMGQFEVTKPSMKLNIKRDDLLKYGVTFADVVEGMQTHFGGMYINTFNMGGRNYKVMVQNDPKYRLDPEAYTDAGETIARELIGTHVFQDMPLKLSKLQVDLETGQGGVAMLSISKDGAPGAERCFAVSARLASMAGALFGVR